MKRNVTQFFPLLFLVALSVALADGVDLGSAVSAIESGTDQVKQVAVAIGLLLSALLAIALVVMLYMRAGGGK